MTFAKLKKTWVMKLLLSVKIGDCQKRGAWNLQNWCCLQHALALGNCDASKNASNMEPSNQHFCSFCYFYSFKSLSDTLNLDECLKAAFEAKNEKNNCWKGLPMPKAWIFFAYIALLADACLRIELWRPSVVPSWRKFASFSPQATRWASRSWQLQDKFPRLP